MSPYLSNVKHNNTTCETLLVTTGINFKNKVFNLEV